jgi:hypothetical protein
MAQEITVNAEFEENGQTVRKPVIVRLDKVPLELKARNELIDKALSEGNYQIAPPTPTGMTQDLIKGASDLAVTHLPSMVGIGVGAARGAAAGAPFGPAGMAVGSLGGAVIGGMAGRGTTQLIQGAQGQPMEPVLETMGRGAMTGLEAEAMGLPFKALSGAITSPMMPTPALQMATQSAKARGITLTAAEQTGSPIFRTLESISERSLTGGQPMKRFMEMRAEQLVQSGEQFGVQFGPVTDAVTRSNRFVNVLQDRVKALKGEASQLFESYIQAAGPKSPVPMAGVYKRAFDIQSDMPLFQSLRNTKLTNPSGTGILDEIQTLQSQGFTSLPLEEMRKIRTALGDIAYPDRLAGTVIVDAPVAAARRLYGAMTEALELNATATGTLPLLQRANQFQKTVIHNLDDSAFYTSILDSNKQLSALSKTLFNPRDTGVLLDAKSIMTPEGWKLIQQQYWDDVFTQAIEKTNTGARGINGKTFAQRLDKDRAVVDTLFNPDQTRELRELQSVMRLVGERGQPSYSDLMGVMVGGGQVLIAGRGLQNALTGDIMGLGTNVAELSAPYFAAKVFTSPSATNYLTKMLRTGKTGAQNVAELARLAARSEAIRMNNKANDPAE